MQKGNTIFLSLTILISICFGCNKCNNVSPSGNTYYADAINGNDDTGDGSQDVPFKSFGRAMDTLQSGEILFLDDGNYGDIVVGRTPGLNRGSNPSKITIPHSKFNNWVSIKAVPGQTAHFNTIAHSIFLTVEVLQKPLIFLKREIEICT